MFCNNCGYKNEKEYKYCYNCGEKLGPKVVDFKTIRKTGMITMTAIFMICGILLSTAVSVFMPPKKLPTVASEALPVLDSAPTYNTLTCSKTGLFNEVVNVYYLAETEKVEVEYSLNAFGVTDSEFATLENSFINLRDKMLQFRNEVGFSYSYSDVISSTRVLSLKYTIELKKIANQDILSLANYKDGNILSVKENYKNLGYDCN